MNDSLTPLPATAPFTIDQAEVAMLSMPRVECPVEHGFFGGFYLRQITMPANSLIASKVHKTNHPFSITKGRVTVYNESTEECETFTAPHVGITTPGTRRLLFIHEETVWTTFHAVGDETDLAKIEEMVITPYVNPILGIPHAMLQHLPPQSLPMNHTPESNSEEVA